MSPRWLGYTPMETPPTNSFATPQQTHNNPTKIPHPNKDNTTQWWCHIPMILSHPKWQHHSQTMMPYPNKDTTPQWWSHNATTTPNTTPQWWCHTSYTTTHPIIITMGAAHVFPLETTCLNFTCHGKQRRKATLILNMHVVWKTCWSFWPPTSH